MKTLLKLILALCMGLCVISCGKDYNPEVKEKIAILLPDSNNIARWASDLKYLTEAVASYGIEANTYTASEDKSGAELQVSQIKTELEKGTKTFIITAVDYNVINESGVFEGHDDLNIICHDRLIFNNQKISYYSSCERELVGEMQALFLLQEFKASGRSSMTLEMLAGPVSDDNAKYYFEGAYKILKPYIDNGSLIVKSDKVNRSDIVLNSWSSEDAYTTFKERLDTYYKYGQYPNLVLCPIDLCAEGVIRAIDEHSPIILRYPSITGQDNSDTARQNLKDGKQAMTIDKSLKEMAYNTALVTNSLMNGVKPISTGTVNNGLIDIPLISSQLTLVTEDNL